MNLQEATNLLDKAYLEAHELPRFTLKDPAFTIPQGYQVQELLLARHLSRGAKLLGRKMGMTSKAKMIQMNISAPIHGFLTDEMQVSPGGDVSLEKRIHAKAEPEMAFITKTELKGEPSLEETREAIAEVCAAIEIIDSRYKDYDFQLPDVVADNCSSSGFVLGTVRKKLADIDYKNLGIIFSVNGKPVHFGSTAAILGDPVLSLQELVKLLHVEGKTLPAGSIVLAGGATAAVGLAAGDKVRAEMQDLGSVEFRVI